jgi:hypothetical protein
MRELGHARKKRDTRKHELKKERERENMNSRMHLLYFAHPEKTSKTLDKPAQNS